MFYIWAVIIIIVMLVMSNHGGRTGSNKDTNREDTTTEFIEQITQGFFTCFTP